MLTLFILIAVPTGTDPALGRIIDPMMDTMIAGPTGTIITAITINRARKIVFSFVRKGINGVQ